MNITEYPHHGCGYAAVALMLVYFVSSVELVVFQMAMSPFVRRTPATWQGFSRYRNVASPSASIVMMALAMVVLCEAGRIDFDTLLQSSPLPDKRYLDCATLLFQSLLMGSQQIASDRLILPTPRRSPGCAGRIASSTMRQ